MTVAKPFSGLYSYILNFMLLCSNPLRARIYLSCFLSLLLCVRACWDCLNLNTKTRPFYRISMLPSWQSNNTSIFLIINFSNGEGGGCCRESAGDPPNIYATLINNGCIDFWRQYIVTQIDIFICSQNNTDFVLVRVVWIVTRKDINW
jgi:hypothetical protein